jgi:hypothetical protein
MDRPFAILQYQSTGPSWRATQVLDIRLDWLGDIWEQLDATVGWFVHFCEEGALGGLGELVNAPEDQIDPVVLQEVVMLVMGR